MNKFKWLIESQIHAAIEEQEDAMITFSKDFKIEYDDDSMLKACRSLFFTATCALRDGIYKDGLYIYKRITGFIDCNGVTIMDSSLIGTEEFHYK